MRKSVKKYAFLTLILSLLTGQLGRLTFFESPIFTYPYEIFAFLYCAILIFEQGCKPVLQIIRQKSIWLLFLFWIGISLLLSYQSYTAFENLFATLYFFRLIFYAVFGLYMYYDLKKHFSILTLANIFFGFSLLVLIVSYLQFFFYSNIGNIAYLGWDPHVNRMVGMYLDPPIAISVYSALLFLSYRFYRITHAKRFVFISMFFCIAILLTYSRGGFIAFGISLFYFLFQLKKYKVVLSVLIAFILFVVFFSTNLESTNFFRTTSISARAKDYVLGLRIVHDRRLLGIGYNHIRAEKSEFETSISVVPFNSSHSGGSFHSSMLIVLVTTGVIGLVLFCIALIKTFFQYSYMRTILLFLFVFSFFDNIILHPIILIVLPFVLFVAQGKEKIKQPLSSVNYV